MRSVRAPVRIPAKRRTRILVVDCGYDHWLHASSVLVSSQSSGFVTKQKHRPFIPDLSGSTSVLSSLSCRDIPGCTAEESSRLTPTLLIAFLRASLNFAPLHNEFFFYFIKATSFDVTEDSVKDKENSEYQTSSYLFPITNRRNFNKFKVLLYHANLVPGGLTCIFQFSAVRSSV